jgi:hypothetical protein
MTWFVEHIWKGQTRKKEVKLFLFANSIILYVENSKDTTKKKKRTNSFSKAARYKTNIKISVFIY